MTKRWNQHSFANKMVADLQLKMAHAVYEKKRGRDNEFYKEWPNETKFVNAVAPLLREQAREVLAGMLTQTGITEEEKMEIHEALVLDHQIPNEDAIRIPRFRH